MFYFLPLFLQEKRGESNDVWSIFFHSALGEDRDEARRIFLSFLLSSNLDLLDVGSGLEISPLSVTRGEIRSGRHLWHLLRSKASFTTRTVLSLKRLIWEIP